MERIGIATVPNGYFGDTARVTLAMIKNQLVCLSPSGSYYRAPLSEFKTVTEAKWHIENHPTLKQYFSNVKFDEICA
jgi:hypothetical protein